MLTDALRTELKSAERSVIDGRVPNRKWEGFDPRNNVRCMDAVSVQRSILLTYCQIAGKHLESVSSLRSLEVGVEKHQQVCRQLGLKEWERLDRLDDIGGNKTDYFFDFVDEEIPPELVGAFDVVICSNVLEHTFDIIKGFERTFALAKNGGLVYFSTPFSIGIHGLQDYWRPTPQAYEKIIPKHSKDYIILEENFGGTLHGVSCFAVAE